MKERYFIAVVLPLDIRKEVYNFKKIIAERYFACHAFKCPAHITLHMPFKWNSTHEGELYRVLNDITTAMRSFEIVLQNFGSFEPRVIYVNVVENNLLRMLRDQVLGEMRKRHVYNGEYRNFGFQPHITISFRNFRKANFFDAWDAFKYQKYERSFFVNEITLLKYQSNNWNQMRSFPFMDSN